MLEQYEPQKFFQWFERITQIPRPSYHEERICDFLEDFAKQHGFPYERDETHNILMRVAASEGRENEPPLLLQSHTDMIAEKESNVEFNFLSDPIRLKVIGNELHADGTTLGADDASGMAIMLAIADSPELSHPPLELLFTAQEEVGLQGIQKFNFELIRSRRMFNLDCGRMHQISVASAGALSAVVEETMQTTVTGGTLIELHICGGRGGHSGLEIHKNRACAANLLGELLIEIQQNRPVRLVTIDTPRRPILGEIRASFLVDEEQSAAVCEKLEEKFNEIKTRFALTDPDLRCAITASPCENAQAVSEHDSRRVTDLLFLLRSGVKKQDAENPEIILTSSVIEAVVLESGQFRFNYAIRSEEDREKELYGNILKETLWVLGFSMRITKNYPGWQGRRDSAMVKLVDRVHNRIFGYAPGHRHIHGGVEVGIIVGALPEMDAVAALPSMANAHTTNELLYLDQVADYWKLITAVLEEKAE